MQRESELEVAHLQVGPLQASSLHRFCVCFGNEQLLAAESLLRAHETPRPLKPVLECDVQGVDPTHVAAFHRMRSQIATPTKPLIKREEKVIALLYAQLLSLTRARRQKIHRLLLCKRQDGQMQ